MNLNIWRNKIGMFARVMTLCTFGFLCFLFLGRLGDDLSTIQDRTGIFFESVSAAPLVGMLNAIALCKYVRTHARSLSACAVTEFVLYRRAPAVDIIAQ